MTLSIHSPDELIAVIPHLLGFKPEESIVFLPMGSDLPVARVDLPTTARDSAIVWDSIRDAFVRYAQPGASVGIVCLAADRILASQVAEDFTANLDAIDIDVHVRVWADDQQWCDLDTRVIGTQTDGARERIAAMTVLAGRPQPAANRESLATSLVGDRDPVAKLLAEARHAASSVTPRADGRWALGRLLRFHADGVRLTDTDTARLLVAVESIPTRDSMWTDMNRASVSSHVALWTDMTRRAPDEVRAAPASMLGFSSWLSGHGAMAWCALDQVPRDRPYALAGLVATAVQTGMHPSEWEAANIRPTAHGAQGSAELTAKRPSPQLRAPRPAHGI